MKKFAIAALLACTALPALAQGQPPAPPAPMQAPMQEQERHVAPQPAPHVAAPPHRSAPVHRAAPRKPVHPVAHPGAHPPVHRPVHQPAPRPNPAPPVSPRPDQPPR